MDPNAAAVNTLNALRRKEAASLLFRLAESTVFVPPKSAGGHAMVQRIIEEEAEHRRWLDQTILELGGNLIPCRADITSADVHYVEWRALVPRVVADQRRLAAAYEAAASEVAGWPAAEIVARIAARHRDHAGQLERMLEPDRPLLA